LYTLLLICFSSYKIVLHILAADEYFLCFQVLQNNSDGSASGSLLQVMNHTLTIFGSRLLKHWVWDASIPDIPSFSVKFLIIFPKPAEKVLCLIVFLVHDTGITPIV